MADWTGRVAQVVGRVSWPVRVDGRPAIRAQRPGDQLHQQLPIGRARSRASRSRATPRSRPGSRGRRSTSPATSRPGTWNCGCCPASASGPMMTSRARPPGRSAASAAANPRGGSRSRRSCSRCIAEKSSPISMNRIAVAPPPVKVRRNRPPSSGSSSRSSAAASASPTAISSAVVGRRSSQSAVAGDVAGDHVSRPAPERRPAPRPGPRRRARSRPSGRPGRPRRRPGRAGRARTAR